MVRGVGRAIGLAAILLALPLTSAAADINPKKLELIRELIQVTDAKKLADSIVGRMIAQVEQSYPQLMVQLGVTDPQNPDAMQQKVMDSKTRFSTRVREMYPQRINVNKLVAEIYEPLYDKYFSEQELKDLVKFYKSSTGKKSLEVTASLMQESLQQLSGTLNTQLSQVVRELLQEEKGKLMEGVQAAQPAATPPAADQAQTPAPGSSAAPAPANQTTGGAS